MKTKLRLTLGVVLLFICLFRITAQSSKQPVDPNTIKIDLGIIDIFDQQVNFNHNQSFKKFLSDQEITFNSKPAKIELIEHASQAGIAVKALFDSSSMIITLYENGNLYRKDTMALDLAQKVSCFYPQFDISLTDAAEVKVTNVKFNSPEYKQGIRDGYIIFSINGSKIGIDELDKAEMLLRQTKSKPLDLILINPSLNKNLACKLILLPTEKSYQNRPYTPEDIAKIFAKIRNVLLDNQARWKMKISPSIDDKSFDGISQSFEINKCKTQDQITTHMSSVHPVSMSSRLMPKNGFSLQQIFKNEKFQIQTNKSNKYQPGDAALYVMRFYNYEQNKTHISKNDKVGVQLRSAVRKISGPFYNKPGVFANYCIAAFEYESSKNYRAALNQYYASLRKLDQIIASDRTKLEAKKFVADRISHCSKQLNQPEYAALMAFASNCVSTALTNSSITEKDKNFYDFTNQIKSVCIEIETQLAEQKKQRIMSIVSAVSSVAGGVASFNIDPTLSLNYLIDAVDILEDFDSYSRGINELITQTTSSMEINLPAELQSEEHNPYEIKATEFIFESLLKEDLDKNVLRLIEEYAVDKQSIKTGLEQFKTTYKITGKMDPKPLLDAFLKHETIVYRYEKRGLKVPDKT